MMRTAALVSTLFTLLVSGPGCKGKEAAKVDDQIQKDLDQCRAAKAEKDKLIAALQDENAKLQVKKASGGEVVVMIEGANFTVKPGPPGEVLPIDPKVAEAGAREFTVVVEKSRGSIQKCYEQALKKTTGLQSKTVTLTVSASFSQQGAYKNANFSPSLGDTFDTCIRAVATKWVLPQNSPAMTFQAQVSLTPS
jgi:hypothetical protein